MQSTIDPSTGPELLAEYERRITPGMLRAAGSDHFALPCPQAEPRTGGAG
jgi:hypothetical protein